MSTTAVNSSRQGRPVVIAMRSSSVRQLLDVSDGRLLARALGPALDEAGATALVVGLGSLRSGDPTTSMTRQAVHNSRVVDRLDGASGPAGLA